jgi:ParB/RepB/Spo0J family partition protein
MKATQNSPLENAVKKTMQAVAKEVMQVGSDSEDRLSVLKKHLGKVVSLKISEIESAENVRKGALANGEEFEKLKASIAQFGLLQPIVVELRATDSSFRLVCLAGHRRLAALKALQHERVQCLLLSFEEKSQRTGAALSENLTREQLHFLDTAEGYNELLEQGWTEEQLAAHFERDAKTIKRFVALARWPEEAKALVRAHPEKFSLRKLMHRYVQRSHYSLDALMAALMAEIEGKATPDGADKRTGSVAGPKLTAKALTKELERYFQERPHVSVEVRNQVEDALRFLKLL